MKLRKLIFHLHLYLGLGVGLLVSVTGLTGSLLVFRHEIDRLLDPRVHRIERPGRTAADPAFPVSAQAVLETVQRAYSGDPVHQLLPPRGEQSTYEVSLKSGRHVYLHPRSGAILGARDPERTPMGFLFAVHRKLLSGENGETAVGVGGILLIVLGLTGVVLWWPGRKGLRSGFTVQWGASWKRVNYDLHRVGGILAAGFLLLIALTGVALVFGSFVTKAVYRATGASPPPKPSVTVPGGGAPLSLDALLRRADMALPGAVTTRITPPSTPGTPLVVRKRLPVELHPNGMSFVYLDPYRGTVLRLDHALLAPAGPRLLNLRYPVHIGHYGGLPARALHAVAGLMPALLFGSGALMWWNRTCSRRRREQGRHARSTATKR